jgi:MYXO-CTERM domain-containing protein
VKRTFFVALSATVLFANAASATPPAAPGQRRLFQGTPAAAPPYVILDLTVAQATAQIAKIATWDVTMQSTSCTDPDAGTDSGATACEEGGIIEVESGPGNAIVASDNTQETIGIWSINQKLNDVSHLTNIQDAFKYLSIHPGYLAWKVAGDPGPADYYSVYNCGWGVRAVMLYEAETGDMSHHSYGLDCANHIAMYAGELATADGALLNVGPSAWAASGLWLWGDTYSDAAMRTTAASIGGQVKAWIEASPSRLSSMQWAMTGATPFYGVIESYMKENPSELAAWDAKYAPMLGGWIDESTLHDPNDWTDWRNAWNGWNMLAHFTSAAVLGATAGKADEQVAKDILTKLVAQANPTTGAISGSQQRPSTEAESWITAYMVYFGLLEVIDAPTVKDAGTEAGAKDAGIKDASHDAPTAPAEAGGSEEGASSGGCGLAGTGGASAAPLGMLALVLAMARRKRRRATAE